MRTANQLIANVSRSAAYERCLDVYEAILPRLQALAERPQAANEISGLRRALAVLRAAVLRAAEDLGRNATEYGGDDQEPVASAARCEQALRNERLARIVHEAA